MDANSRQSYDISQQLSCDIAPGVVSRNVVNLKEPYYRYVSECARE